MIDFIDEYKSKEALILRCDYTMTGEIQAKNHVKEYLYLTGKTTSDMLDYSFYRQSIVLAYEKFLFKYKEEKIKEIKKLLM